LENPYIKYSVHGYLEGNRVMAYVAVREEKLMPEGDKVHRIIDIYGNKDKAGLLISHVGRIAAEAGAIYLDFSMFGVCYEDVLQEEGYNKLTGEDVSLLPMVTNPVQKKSNNEFIVLQSKKHDEAIRTLEKKDVYFTRIDADRDRIAKIDQIRKG
jgi:hypothetical protein